MDKNQLGFLVFILLASAGLSSCGNGGNTIVPAVTAATATVTPQFKVFQPQDVVLFSGGTKKVPLDIAFGSAAFHLQTDPANIVYTMSDRGPNIKCKDSFKVFGAAVGFCPTGNKIFPVPSFSPSIFKWQIDHTGVTLLETIKMKDAAGKPITGVSNPSSVLLPTEANYDKNAVAFAGDPNGLDPEAFVKMQDGTFWVGEEYGPSILHLSATGRVIERLVPSGVEVQLAAATYPVVGSLPAILSKRKLNRGIEDIAISPNEQFLYFLMQSPLANPAVADYKTSRNARLFKFDLVTKTVVGEYVYQLDLPATFSADATTVQSNVKLSEMVATGLDQLIVLERVSNTTKLYRINLAGATNIFGTNWDVIGTLPSLEQSNLITAGIASISKTLAMDSSVDYPGLLPPKVEGIGLLNNNELVLINDNDFGIFASPTQITIIPPLP
ncbi:esterase-like activity of phytase family protein [Mariprofundus sp. EBB-1]|uniref:esterase-like activity of phytase family protein n=1 Tax=Mariprofundus sp. EBB-1 TaxID=2650971 RepID=UPI000EF26915|nr:esterase-like activity of phytase family protein [Mariprofundus sp. EBB-1]RLL53262.1 esterase-like activity of phytase family protein [Mariprofundus sp. EBB-1]